MRIAVVGLWHLGTITSLGLSNFIRKVYAFDDDKKIINNFMKFNPPVNEAGIINLLKKNLNKTLFFSDNFEELKNFNLVWICNDAIIDQKDKSSSILIYNKIKFILNFVKKNTNIIISTQIPLGTIKKLENYDKQLLKKKINFFYIPENLRIGKSLKIFFNPERLIIGTRYKNNYKKIKKLLDNFKCKKYIVSPETAELTKHTINSFLACSISFINEIGEIAKNYHIKFDEFEKCIKSDSRLGFRSYLRPGNPFSGGTLARDLNFLVNCSKHLKTNHQLIKSIYKSNQFHKMWVENTIKKNLNKRKITNILQVGIGNIKHSSTIRRSFAYDIFNKLKKKYNVKIFDEYIRINSKEISRIKNYFVNNNDLLNYIKKSDLIILFSKFENKLPFNFSKKKVVIDVTSENISFINKKKYNYYSYEH